MDSPDLRGYDLESQICSTASRLVVLWFSKLEHEAERWRQIQVTLIGARLSMANLKIVHGFPPLRSCEISERPTAHGNRIQFSIYFEEGEISFECENMVFSEYARNIKFVRGAET